MKAYGKVRGLEYFVLDRPERESSWWRSYGDQHYDPQAEIPGWEGFLRQFARHPGADDAAYRLARSYEVQGDYTRALNWFYRAPPVFPTGTWSIPPLTAFGMCWTSG